MKGTNYKSIGSVIPERGMASSICKAKELVDHVNCLSKPVSSDTTEVVPGPNGKYSSGPCLARWACMEVISMCNP